MARFLSLVPGADLLRQAWDATRLAGAMVAQRREKALVLAEEERAKAVAKRIKPEEAHKQLKQLFEEEKYQEVAKLFFPDKVVDFAVQANEVYWKVWDLYWILAIARIVLALYQPGYIHPDEYFQSVEVISGDVFNLDVNRTWEFNATAPIRSMALPCLLFGTPLLVYKGLIATTWYYTGLDMLSPYMVWVIPRLVMVTLSFVIDVCVYKICTLYKHNVNQCLATLASSYVMLVYATRTFSNTIEMVLVAILIYLVAHCKRRSTETIRLEELVRKSHDKAETMKEKESAFPRLAYLDIIIFTSEVQLMKKRKAIPPHDFKHCLTISVLCAVGVFNRPTFVAFALVPLFFWFQRGIVNDSYFTPNVMFTFRYLSIIPGAIITSCLLTFFDSLYYGDLTLTKLWELSMDWSDWKCCPLNFIMYNMVPGNLDKHGTHPIYLHALVNVPLLWGPLGVATLISVLVFFNDVLTNSWKDKPGLKTVYAMTVFSFVVPLALLSWFPHQEPRFLIPLTIPCVLLCSHKLRSKPFGGSWDKATPFKTFWYIFNVGLLLLYGFIHQGGVYPTIRYISFEHQYATGVAEANFVWSHTYMPPKFLLHQRYKLDRVEVRKHFHDLSGADLPDVHNKLVALASRANYFKKVKLIETYVVIPTHLKALLEVESNGALTFTHVYRVFPHLSTESPPEWDPDLIPLLTRNPVAGFEKLAHWLGDFSLSLCKVQLGDVNTVEVDSDTQQRAQAK